ncbi:MAG: Mu-like prophage major head subunit gpT family protein [Smithella sp.]
MIINQANLAGIYRTYSTIFNQALDQAESMVNLIAMRTPSSGASVDYTWFGSFPMLREWLGDRVIKDLAAFHYEIKNKRFEATVGVNADHIEDDQIGIYSPMVQELGRSAKVHPDILAFALMAAGFSTVCYDGQYFFDSDHPVKGASVSNTGGGAGNPWFLLDLSRAIKPIVLQIRRPPRFVSLDKETDQNAFMRNEYLYGVDDRKNVGFALWQLAYGSKAALTEANYVAAGDAMIAFTNDEGVPLGIKPTHLIVGGTNRAAGKAIIEKAYKAGGESNEWFQDTKLVVCPWLR